jgi:hypothetical protein
VHDVAVLRIELARDVRDVVAALGDGEGHDPRRLGGHPLDRRLRVVRGEQVVGDRADHAAVVALRAALDQRVQPVLGAERVAHPPVGGQHAEAADPPFARSRRQQAVVEHRLVRAVERADADVHDARHDVRAVEGGRREAIAEVGERGGGEVDGHAGMTTRSD